MELSEEAEVLVLIQRAAAPDPVHTGIILSYNSRLKSICSYDEQIWVSRPAGGSGPERVQSSQS